METLVDPMIVAETEQAVSKDTLEVIHSCQVGVSLSKSYRGRKDVVGGTISIVGTSEGER